MRSITSAMLAALAAEQVVPVIFVELDFLAGFVRVHSAVGDIVFQTNTYQGVGHLGELDTIGETAELKASGIKLSLRGIPNDIISTALNDTYQNRPARVWLGALDTNYALIADPVMAFSGRMDNMNLQLGEDTGTVTLTVENRLVDWDRPRVLRYNNTTQQRLFPNDKGLEFAEEMVERTIFWGTVPTYGD